MTDLTKLEVWFVVGSQPLYGEEILGRVREHAREMAEWLAQSSAIPVKIELSPLMTSADSITQLCLEANRSAQCIGLLFWMHTFSPAQMWIPGLDILRKPFAHLHTQHNRHLPWDTLDMDFMNENQSAHGDREFGFLTARMGLKPKVITGFWQEDAIVNQIAAWCRAAAAWHEWRSLRIARFGDNMRNVAVTEGDKAEARIQFGYSVEGFGVGDLVDRISNIGEADINRLVERYYDSYEVACSLNPQGQRYAALREAARIELGIENFLEEGGFGAFTDTFEDLHGLNQLPGIAVQRLMAKGYGFGAEGDWKTASLVRAMKVMGLGLPGGTSFMEYYTYDFGSPSKVLGAHMLEVCPSIADRRPSLEIHPLSIGGKADPVRLVFDARSGPAVNVSLVDLGNRFRMVLNEVEVVPPDEPLTKLPVARAVWIPKPDLEAAASAWILAGGSHHTSFSQAVTAEHLSDFADIAGVEFLRIGQDTTLNSFKNELRWNDVHFSRGRKQ
ncbi:MAG TPA: L-arabinose isomerase [Terriglobales bacterium]|nr:L-arabinose isomerase [Terriglobales bacterium]